ncbi:MAG: hypothetical protein LBC04_03730 [Holosporaceae bacterium]|jgi:hypothetical protein|nr:hypothetical protein [Holosporaceae bacterium]
MKTILKSVLVALCCYGVVVNAMNKITVFVYNPLRNCITKVTEDLNRRISVIYDKQDEGLLAVSEGIVLDRWKSFRFNGVNSRAVIILTANVDVWRESSIGLSLDDIPFVYYCGFDRHELTAFDRGIESTIPFLVPFVADKDEIAALTTSNSSTVIGRRKKQPSTTPLPVPW